MRIEDDAVLRSLDRRHFSDLGAISPARNPRSITPIPPSSVAQPADRVIVHAGRHRPIHDIGESGAEIDERGIAAGHDTQLRRKQKVVECAAANELEQIHAIESTIGS